MAIEIHIRVRDTDWDSEHEFADLIAEQIIGLIPENLNVPVLVIPVEDPANEMKPLMKIRPTFTKEAY